MNSKRYNTSNNNCNLRELYLLQNHILYKTTQNGKADSVRSNNTNKTVKMCVNVCITTGEVFSLAQGWW